MKLINFIACSPLICSRSLTKTLRTMKSVVQDRFHRTVENSTLLAMKITAFILLAIGLQANAIGYSQKISLSQKNATLEHVFREIKKQSGYLFWYENKLLQKTGKIDLDLVNVSVDEALNIALKDQPLTFSIVGKTVVLKKKAEEPVIPDIADLPPPIEVKGRVVDDVGQPIPGVSVLIKGTQIGTQTDANGSFTLPNVPEDGTLVFSAVGYGTKEEKVGGRKSFTVYLNPVVSTMDETVIVAYGKSKIKDITGSISRLGPKDIQNAPMGASLQSLLQGRASGVNVSIQSASPSSPVSVVIRGASSLSGNNQPLWVIDGIPDYSNSTSGNIANTLFNLNLTDVESIDILKDASATALYGSRAANGVVIVTTKRGLASAKPTIQFTTRWGLQVQDWNHYEYMESPAYKHFANRAARIEAFGRGAFDYFTRLYLDEQAFMSTNSSEFDMETFEILPGAYYEGNTDWQKEMARNPWNQQHDLSLRGGAQGLSYYVSLYHRNDQGIIKSGQAKTFGGRLNLEASLRKGLKFGLNLSGNTRNVDDKDYMLSVIKMIRPDIPPYNPDGTLFTRDAYTENPYTTLRNTRNSTSQMFSGSAYLEWEIISGLVARTQYNNQFVKGETLNYTRKGSQHNTTGTRQRNDSRNESNVWENTLTYAKNFGKHDVTAMAGFSAEKYTSLAFGMNATSFPDDDVLNDFSSGATRGALTESYNANTLLSQYARAHYKFNNRYIISGTIRRDGSSRFGPGKRWGLFPSAAVGWIISEEEFVKNSPVGNFVSYLKLRASRGKAGSQNLGNYAWRTNVGSSRYNELPAIAPSSVGNTELQWEEALLTDFGLDFGLWDERIRGTFGVYTKLTEQLIYSKPLPPSTSFANLSSNVGSVKNNGIEFDVTVDIYRGNNLNIEIDFNASKNINRIMKINGVVKELSFGGGQMIAKEGDRTNQWFGYQTANRLFVSAEEVIALKPRTATGGQTNYRIANENAGDLLFIDNNGDGRITADDRVYIGSADPKLYGGFGATATYKGLRINTTFTYAYGHKRLWKMPMDDVGYVGNYNHAIKIAGNSATVKDPIDATIPRMTHYGDGGNSTFSDFWLYDASFVRLNALNITYRIPSRLFADMLVQGIDLSFQASNLLTITKYPGFDPQGGWSSSAIGTGMGVDNSTYPAAKNFNFSVVFTFK